MHIQFPLVPLINTFSDLKLFHFISGYLIAGLGGVYSLKVFLENMWEKRKSKARQGFISLAVAIAGAVLGLYLLAIAFVAALLYGLYLLIAMNAKYAVNGDEDEKKN